MLLLDRQLAEPWAKGLGWAGLVGGGLAFVPFLGQPGEMESASPKGPLHGVRVADLSTVVMGPLAARILADLGADVIKIEPPGGEMTRQIGQSHNEGMTPLAINVNRNKRSVVLDLKSPDGRQAALDLIATCDVFVTNMRLKALDRLGLGYESVSAVRPDIVYGAGTGFGSDGPYRDKPAYDDVIQAVSGLASVFNLTDDQPRFIPSIVADKVASLHVVYAILAALFRRSTTGEGDFVEIPMAESLATFNLVEHLSGLTFDPPLGAFSYERVRSTQRRPRRSADGWICILPYSNANWRDFFTLAGCPEIADDERFATISSRLTHVDALYSHLDEIMIKRTTAEWIADCDRLSIPAVPVVDLEYIDQDPHFEAVGLLESHVHPSEGPYRVIRDPVTFRSGNPGLYRHAPSAGQHTEEVLRQIGYSPEQIEALGSDSSSAE